ncbi:MAG TPA: hypothetical protein VGT41_01890 [Candidatus Babeliales bacterium]|nr:hypothetical protein [Candidatus Babeliales bacterium]
MRQLFFAVVLSLSMILPSRSLCVQGPLAQFRQALRAQDEKPLLGKKGRQTALRQERLEQSRKSYQGSKSQQARRVLLPQEPLFAVPALTPAEAKMQQKQAQQRLIEQDVADYL